MALRVSVKSKIILALLLLGQYKTKRMWCGKIGLDEINRDRKGWEKNRIDRIGIERDSKREISMDLAGISQAYDTIFIVAKRTIIFAHNQTNRFIYPKHFARNITFLPRKKTMATLNWKQHRSAELQSTLNTSG